MYVYCTVYSVQYTLTCYRGNLPLCPHYRRHFYFRRDGAARPDKTLLQDVCGFLPESTRIILRRVDYFLAVRIFRRAVGYFLRG